MALRKAAELATSANRQLASLQLTAAAESAEMGLRALQPSAGSTARQMERALLNVQGVALHLQGDYDSAHEQLEACIKLDAIPADSYADLAGALSDSAANHIARGSVDEAEAALKRGAFMLRRSYRPSAAASAVLLRDGGELLGSLAGLARGAAW